MEKIGVIARTFESELAQLKNLGILYSDGGRKDGKCVILERKVVELPIRLSKWLPKGDA